jgi:hypothetical protein
VSTFQRAIEFVLGEDLLFTNVRVYLDEILIFTKTLEEHSFVLEKVLERLSKAGLRL